MLVFFFFFLDCTGRLCILYFCSSSNLIKANRPDSITLEGKRFSILYVTHICLLVCSYRGLHTEKWRLETLQMGQLVPYCGPSLPDGKMSQKCQGKPSWPPGRYSSMIQHWTTPKKRPNSPTLKYCHRLHIGTVAISQTLVQYFICPLFNFRL